MTEHIKDLDLQELDDCEITCDSLTPEWNIYQLKRGHRFSSDDIFTAHVATLLQPNAVDCLDLGAGIGTVGLLSLWNLQASAKLHMIEAQQVSHQLACKTIEKNKLQSRVCAIHGDIRDRSHISRDVSFDLITGSPPYFPLGKGLISPHPQRAACRMELRGSVQDYVDAASDYLNATGLFAICFPHGDSRCKEALIARQFNIIACQDIVFRHDLHPTISVFAATKDQSRQRTTLNPIVIRGPKGQFTENYLGIRKRMGQP